MTKRIVGIGGALRPGSSTEKSLQLSLEIANQLGAHTQIFTGSDIDLPLYAPENTARSPAANRLVNEMRQADALIIASPAYHGGLSGAIKNALDYVEDLREDTRSYFSGRAVGCIITAAGQQASVTALTSLRSIVHSLRGWPTPLGVTINTAQPVFDGAGRCIQAAIQSSLQTMVEEVIQFGREPALRE